MNCVGRRVNHKIFGSGLIVSQTDNDIFVKFEAKPNEIGFQFPDENYQKFFDFDIEYDKKREDVIKILSEYISGNPKGAIIRAELIDVVISKLPEEKTETIIEIVRGVFKDLPTILNLIPGNQYIVKGKTIFVNQEQSDFTQSFTAESLISHLTYYIIYNDINEISKDELYQIALKGYFEPNNIESQKLSKKIIRKIVTKLNNLSGKIYGRTDDSIYIISESPSIEFLNYDIVDNEQEITEADIQEDIIDLLSDYIISNNVNEITISQLSSYLHESYFLQNNIEPIELSNSILEALINEIYTKQKDEYLFLEGKLYKKDFLDELNNQKKAQEKLEELKKLSSDYSSFIANYLIEKRFEKITKGEICNYAMRNFFLKRKLSAIKFSNEIVESVLSLIFKDKSIQYEYKKNTFIKKFDSKLIKPIQKSDDNIISTSDKIETISDPQTVSDLLKSFLKNQNKQVYTVEELKLGLIKHYKKNPGKIITRQLLIKLCVELFEKEKKYYFVDGDNATLKLWKALSFQEWQFYGLGTVYNPAVKVKDRVLNIRDFTLYVYESVNSVTCGKSSAHPTEEVTINTTTLSGYPVSFNAYYCSKCNKYFTTKAAIEYIFPRKNYPFIKLKLMYSEGVKLQSETVLHIFGYTVKADGPSEMQRENLLSKLLTYGVVTKKEVEGLLWHLIHYNGKKKNMANAKAKWESDLEFVRDFNLSKQRQINAKKVRIK